MFVSDRLVFVDLPKTASSHVRRLLARIEGGEERGVHVPASRALRRRRDHFWGTIRDPWDWYVSLWAYGCDGRGTLYQALTSDLGWLRSRGWKHAPVRAALSLRHGPRRRRDFWREAYADVTSPACFQRWLRGIHDPSAATDLGDAYAASGLAEDIGLLTYRYLRLYCGALPRPPLDAGALAAFDRQHCYITRFLRTERLEEDLAAAFEALGRPLTSGQRRQLSGEWRTNASSRERDTAFYYDEESRALVAARDRLVVDRFGYRPPAD